MNGAGGRGKGGGRGRREEAERIRRVCGGIRRGG